MSRNSVADITSRNAERPCPPARLMRLKRYVPLPCSWAGVSRDQIHSRFAVVAAPMPDPVSFGRGATMLGAQVKVIRRSFAALAWGRIC